MPNIISLPTSISSPTGVRLFRGRKHGLLTLAGRFNVDEKNLLPRGRNKRKIRIKQRRNWCINHWSLQCCFTNPWRKAGRRKVWPCPPGPQVVLFFLTTDHSNASLFLSVGPHKIPALHNLWATSRGINYSFSEGHMLWLIQIDSLNITRVFLLT